jgi:hypothetical protein
MRFTYNRLKWNASVLQRVLYGDKTHNRQLRAQAQNVMELALMELSSDTVRSTFASQWLPKPRKTNLEDLVAKGYKLKANETSSWTTEEIR